VGDEDGAAVPGIGDLEGMGVGDPVGVGVHPPRHSCSASPASSSRDCSQVIFERVLNISLSAKL
jgi:hypothetical protein